LIYFQLGTRRTRLRRSSAACSVKRGSSTTPMHATPFWVTTPPPTTW
jgi:hypothetical protein